METQLEGQHSRVRERYRGFLITVAASRRFGGVLVLATLSGGPEDIGRNFGLPSQERDPECACAVALHELRKVVDDLLDVRGNAEPAARASRRV